MRKIFIENGDVSPITATKQYRGTDITTFVSKSDNLIDADTLQAAAEIALGRVI
ncbi:MAG TPA: hypothetical protein O0Y06_08055 [Methanocorpusculum sp.]|nr:hypothetical protein [Methanocorpusculum sp.]HJK80838.1 hypothetical protein [Methanocorpusculum sp.]